MQTEVIQLDLTAYICDPTVGAEGVGRTVEVLAGGGLVAIPTETVYGLAARADHAGAMERLRSVKGRSSEQAFTVHIAHPKDARRYAPKLDGVGARLARKAWPGPLTLIVPVEDPSTTPASDACGEDAIPVLYHGDTVGLRCPDDRATLDVLTQVDAPVVATSANPAGKPPPQTADDVLGYLSGQVDLILDTGQSRYGKSSTIVRLTESGYDILREGVLDAGIIQRLARLSLLFVCTGNTCRSPMAAALASKIFAERLGCSISSLLDHGVLISSAGTSGGFGAASPHAVKVMDDRQVDLSGHQSTLLTAERVHQADHVFAMTRGHLDCVVGMASIAGDRARLLLTDEDVLDPIGGSEDDYATCASAIEAGVRARLEEVTL